MNLCNISVARRWIALLASACASAAPASIVSIRTIAVTGGNTPISGVTFDSLSDPMLTESGSVTFWARLAGLGVTTANDGAWWSDRTGAMSLVAREGQLVSGLPLAALPTLAINEAREGLLVATFPGSLAFHPGFLHLAFARLVDGQEGTLTPVSTDSGGATPSATIASRPHLPASGPVFWTDSLLLRSSASSTPIVERAPVPGIELIAGLPTWGFNGIGTPSSNDLGEVVFWASVGPTPRINGTPFSNGIAGPQRTGIWRYAGGATQLVTGEGLPLPGGPSSHVWSSLGSRPRSFADGSFLLCGRATGEGVSEGNESRLLRVNPDGSVAWVLAAGDPVPGAPEQEFGPLPTLRSCNSRGDTAFVAPVRNAPVGRNMVLAVARDATLEVIARRGDQAPGLPQGVMLDTLRAPTLNGAGRVAFMAGLRGEGVDRTNEQVLYATTRRGDLVPVMRTGDLFATPTGQSRSVRRVVFAHETDSAGHVGYTTGGQLVLVLEFTDDTAAIVVASVDCVADFNADDTVDGEDIIGFFAAWDSGDHAADVDGSQGVDSDDIILFFARFEAGC